MVRVHWSGDPDGCSADCRGPHHEDAAPAVCSRCGSNGRACLAAGGCAGAGRRWEPFEGHRGDEGDDEPPDGQVWRG